MGGIPISIQGYGSYRGRAAWKRIIKIFALILLILAILCGVTALYLQQFLYISDDGVRLDLPFAQSAEPTPTHAIPIVEPSVVVIPSAQPE